MEKKKDKIKIKKMGNGKKRGREIVKKKKKQATESFTVHPYQLSNALFSREKK
jgi:chromatin remodeling complex protein RSC6